MQRLHEEIGKQLLEALRLYSTGQISLEEVKKINKRENIAYDLKSFKSRMDPTKLRIFERTRVLYDKVTELSRNITVAERLNEGNEIEVEESALLAHAQLLGRNRAPDPCFSNSSWFLGPFPTVQMLDALRSQEKDKS